MSACPCIGKRALDSAVICGRFGVRNLVRTSDRDLIQVDIAEIEPDGGWRPPDVGVLADDDLDMGAGEGFSRMVRFSFSYNLKKALFYAGRLCRVRHSRELPSYPVSALFIGLAWGMRASFSGPSTARSYASASSSSSLSRSGSASLFGGVIGSILISMLLNGLVLMNVSSYIPQIVIGVIIVLSRWRLTRSRSRGGEGNRTARGRQARNRGCAAGGK
jgi:hypothetical protein